MSSRTALPYFRHINFIYATHINKLWEYVIFFLREILWQVLVLNYFPKKFHFRSLTESKTGLCNNKNKKMLIKYDNKSFQWTSSCGYNIHLIFCHSKLNSKSVSNCVMVTFRCRAQRRVQNAGKHLRWNIWKR